MSIQPPLRRSTQDYSCAPRACMHSSTYHHQEFIVKTAHHTSKCNALFFFVRQDFARTVWQSCSAQRRCQAHSKAAPLSCGLRRSGLPPLFAVGLSSAARLSTSCRSRQPNPGKRRISGWRRYRTPSSQSA
ncbi:hypothetical protein Tharo_2612 [Thauera aromatica K172]|uniref:Uncharacterized protein n=1 Tax=Thauera aromatica K172 TaxID=44139 RepID=A0A2R4BQ88_THAAR|nr:hypothetical protein Tharo_2612 [Thauera aromatica K172]